MKKLLFIIMLGLSLNVQAQNSVCFTFSPVDLGVGVRYDHYFKNNGLYLSGTYGNYTFNGGYIKDHYKLAFGWVRDLNKTIYVNAGLSLHKYGKRLMSWDYDLTRVLSPISYEIGIGTYINHFKIGFRIDPYKWDSAIDIGFKF